MSGFWLERKYCDCDPGVRERSEVIVVDGLRYCQHCRCRVTDGETESPDGFRVRELTSSGDIQCGSCGHTSVESNHFCGQCGAVLPSLAKRNTASAERVLTKTEFLESSDGLDDSAISEKAGTQDAANQPSPPLDVPEESRFQRGTLTFKLLYGWSDPVLWLAIAFTLPAVLTQGAGLLGAAAYLAMVLPLAILVLSVLRYPLAIATRSWRLSRSRPSGSKGGPQWLGDPARLGTWRLWNGTDWSATVSGHPPPAKKGVALATVSAGVALTGLFALSLVAGGAVNFGPSSVAGSSDPSLRRVQQDIRLANEQYVEAQRRTEAFAASPDPESLDLLSTSLDQAAAILVGLKTDIRALPSSVSPSEREDLQEYAVTGLAAVNDQANLVRSAGVCLQRSTIAQTEFCIGALEGTYGNRSRALQQKWMDAAKDVGY